MISIESGDRLEKVECSFDSPSQIRLTNGGRSFVVGYENGMIEFFEMNEKDKFVAREKFQLSASAITEISLSDTFGCATSADNSIACFSLKERRPLGTLRGHSGRIDNTFTFENSSRRGLVSSSEKKSRVWFLSEFALATGTVTSRRDMLKEMSRGRVLSDMQTDCKGKFLVKKFTGPSAPMQILEVNHLDSPRIFLKPDQQYAFARLSSCGRYLISDADDGSKTLQIVSRDRSGRWNSREFT